MLHMHHFTYMYLKYNKTIHYLSACGLEHLVLESSLRSLHPIEHKAVSSCFTRKRAGKALIFAGAQNACSYE